MIDFRLSPVYKQAYNSARNIINGKAKAASTSYARFFELGKENPAQAKLLNKVAIRDVAFDSGKNINILSSIKTAFKTFCVNSKDFKTEKKAFIKRYKELYPKTHKMRDKLIKQGRVKFDSKLDVRMKDLGLRKF
ncbi:MAG: hypothetical protein E7Z89_06890 [Cyanobacteria bacterium SIG28]|nr:hypothetical protein [Cyanobacteria bacterium SIG28]